MKIVFPLLFIFCIYDIGLVPRLNIFLFLFSSSLSYPKIKPFQVRTYTFQLAKNKTNYTIIVLSSDDTLNGAPVAFSMSST